MIPGFVVIWQGKITTGYLTKDLKWSLDPVNAHVYATWASAKTRSRSFKGADVVEAWI